MVTIKLARFITGIYGKKAVVTLANNVSTTLIEYSEWYADVPVKLKKKMEVFLAASPLQGRPCLGALFVLVVIFDFLKNYLITFFFKFWEYCSF